MPDGIAMAGAGAGAGPPAENFMVGGMFGLGGHERSDGGERSDVANSLSVTAKFDQLTRRREAMPIRELRRRRERRRRHHNNLSSLLSALSP